MILPLILALQAAPTAATSAPAQLGAADVKVLTGRFRADLYYPEYAQRMGISDAVEATCRIAANAALEDCSVSQPQTKGYGFDEAALKLLAASRVVARTKSGEPILGRTLHLTIRFTSRSRNDFRVHFE